MRKILKNVIKISILMLFILIGFYINANSSYALTAKEVQSLKKGDSLEVTTKSKIYIYRDTSKKSDVTIYKIIEAEEFKNQRIPVGTRFDAGVAGDGSKKTYIKQNNVYYVSVDYHGIACYVHYKNLKKRTVSSDEESKVQTFLKKDIVQDILMGKANDYVGSQRRKYSDSELISIASEANELNLETGDSQVNQVLQKTLTALKNRGYTVSSTNDGGVRIADSDGNVVETLAGGDAEVNGDIFYQPSKSTSGDTSEENLDDLIEDAENFVDSGDADGVGVIDTTSLQNFSKTLYNILLAIGVAAAVIVGAILGIKLMVAGVEEKAEIKKLIAPYVVGCVVIFGGFTIWKIVVEILSNI